MLVAYDSLDPALKRELPITRSNTGELAVKFVRHEEAKTNAMFAGTHARGGANSFLWISEWGVIQSSDLTRSEEILTGALPSVGDGVCVVETTWRRAQRALWSLVKSALETPEEYPTHRMLQELLQLDSGGDARLEDLATRLLPWCAGGNYGCLLDGTSNISLTGKIAHFELGYIPEAAKLLRAVAGFLITNYTRQHIITMPRGLRKRNIYEEVARLLDIPGGDQIVKESYAQMRKFNCWNISIVQQYAQFKESRIHSAVFGNSRQFFLMRQNDLADLHDMAQDIALSDATKQTILSYPLPDQQPAEKFAAFTYLHTDAVRPVCGTAHNVASAEMLYISGSSGGQFDERAQQLRDAMM